MQVEINPESITKSIRKSASSKTGEGEIHFQQKYPKEVDIYVIQNLFKGK